MVSDRRRPIIVSTRATRAEKALIQAAAAQEGISVAEFVHRFLMACVREKLAHVVNSPLADQPGEGTAQR